MKKLVVLTAVLLVSAIGVTACSVPNIGKMEIINAVKEAAEEAQEPDVQESAAAPEAQAPDAGGATASDEGQEAAVEENVPQVAAQNEKGEGGKEEKEGKDKYAERIECKTAVIGGNNMIVQVKNNNDIPIPTLTVHVNYQDGKKSYDFHQVPPGGQIVIPVEKGEGDLPPAVSADVSVCMDENEYTGLSSLLNIAESKTNSAYTLSVTNTADIACRKMTIAVLFSNETGVICVLTTTSPEMLAPGASTTFTFTLPQSFTDEGISFTNATYVMNEAVG